MTTSWRYAHPDLVVPPHSLHVLPSFADTVYQAKNIALQGTLCVGGSGLGLVFQIGDNTVLCVIPVSLPA
jgi:hypothetical protein